MLLFIQHKEEERRNQTVIHQTLYLLACQSINFNSFFKKIQIEKVINSKLHSKKKSEKFNLDKCNN